jgi:hypothetical protein
MGDPCGLFSSHYCTLRRLIDNPKIPGATGAEMPEADPAILNRPSAEPNGYPFTDD